MQIIHPEYGRRTALVNGDELHLLATYRSAYAFAMAAIDTGQKLRDLLSTDLSGIVLDYREVHTLRSAWRFLPSFDHPEHPSCCLVSGCANAHDAGKSPAAPPWFTKGNGVNLRAHGEALTIPGFASGGAEEAELAAVYVIGPDGLPRRVGLTPGNEFADPAMVGQDARLLSRAKLRSCAIGPELALDAEFQDVAGSVAVERGGAPIWSKEIRTGEKHTAFRLEEIERHHFQFEAHRIPGDAHVHFLGGSISSFGDEVVLEEGDQVVIQWEGFGRLLRNPIERERAGTPMAAVLPL
ncbi:MAG: fumarylacetoacetate hydrolase [Bryobacterales bacterium]|nr:fumarylacetoacetate hydrolase [Bryobacterales bacterium]